MKIEVCPLCSSRTLSLHLTCEDHTVSHETFSIVTCNQCNFTFTNPVPDNLEPYYESSRYISHTGSSGTLVDQIYLIARRYTLKWKERLVRTNTHVHGSLLDYGCGTGAFITHCKSNGWQINGLEPASIARTQAERSSGIPIASNLTNLSGESFDAITLWHVLEHVSDLHATLEHLAKILAASGTIFIAVPNHMSMDSHIYKQHWAAYDVPRHLWHFSQDTMTKLLTQHGLTVTRVLPMKLDAYYVSLLSEQYLNGSKKVGNYLRAMRNALRSNHRASTTGQYSSLIYVARK